jgi:uncharacterized protein (TIGR03435 family)
MMGLSSVMSWRMSLRPPTSASQAQTRKPHEATALGRTISGRFKAINEPLWRLIAEAYRSNYQLRRFEIEGIPRLMDSDRFDVDAVPQGNPSFHEQRQMLQRLLADRFKGSVEVLVIDHMEPPTPN